MEVLRRKIGTYLDDNPDAPNRELAEEFGISESAASSIRVYLGRPAKRTSKQMEALRENYARFMEANPKAKTKIAAEALGTSRDMIVYIRKNLGMSRPRCPKARARLKNKIREILEKSPETSDRELAALVNRPKSTVVTLRRELQMSRSVKSSRDMLFYSIAQQVRQMLVRRGHFMTDRELADRVGVALSTIKRWLRRMGIPTGRSRKFGPDEEYFRKMWADGWSDVEISKVMGCGYQRVQKWRKRNNLVANMIHHSVRTNAVCRSHTPTTLLDLIGSPTGSLRLDKVWAFAALGCDKTWLRKRFPDVKKEDIDGVIRSLLNWTVPVHLRRIIRTKQLREDEKGKGK